MTDLTRNKASGVVVGSRSARRIEAGAGGPAERLGTRLRRVPALLVSWIVAQAGVILLAIAMIGLGFLVTKLVLSIDAVAHADERLPIWFEAHRTTNWTEASRLASKVGDVPVMIPLIGITALALVIWHRWRTASFIVQAALAEATVYGLTVAFVHRLRPPVDQLDGYAINHSFPSGHTAASVAVYGALALLLTAHFRGMWKRTFIWTVAIAIPVIVATSRIYRGEHHPIDVAAGALLGVGAIAVAVFAARTARVTAELRAKPRPAEATS